MPGLAYQRAAGDKKSFVLTYLLNIVSMSYRNRQVICKPHYYECSQRWWPRVTTSSSELSSLHESATASLLQCVAAAALSVLCFVLTVTVRLFAQLLSYSYTRLHDCIICSWYNRTLEAWIRCVYAPRGARAGLISWTNPWVAFLWALEF